MKILSFIIPSYNSEQFLEKCLDSFIDDDVIEKLDIIVVNDGSMDNTSAIAQTFCDRYPNSFRLISQENRGHGGAINTGCSQAKGKYLKVIDADDWVETQNLLKFVDQLENIESDVVLTHNYTINVKDGVIKKWMSYPISFGDGYTIDYVVSNWDLFSRSFTFHGITYNTDFYRKHNYLLSEKVFYEDHEHSTFPACFANSVTPIDTFIYNYRIGDENQSVSDVNRAARADNMSMVLKRFVSECKKIDSERIKLFVSYKCKILLMSYLTTALLSEPNKSAGKLRAKEIMKYFKEEMPCVYNLALKQYILFYILNVLCFKKNTLDRLLTSKLYLKIKGARNFE